MSDEFWPPAGPAGFFSPCSLTLTLAVHTNVHAVLFYNPVSRTGRQQRASPVLFSPGPSARTLAASCDGSTFILKGLMGICCLNNKCKIFVERKQEVRKGKGSAVPPLT